jgi:ATP-dependent RNA helicase DDX41
MPKEIEDYVHEIGRTGRSGKTGLATTFINLNTSEQTLLDLKYLLMEAKQKWVPHIPLPSSPTMYGGTDNNSIPEFLLSVDDPGATTTGGNLKGCPICGGELSFPPL